MTMDLFADLRRAARTLAKKPLFALVAVLTLALGIGASTAMFSVLHAAVLRPLPFAEPERLVRVYSTFEGQVCCTVSAPNFLDLGARVGSFELAAYSPGSFNVTGGDEPVRVPGYRVSGGFFDLLGAHARVGRLIRPEDDRFGAEPVAVLSEGLWRERFGGDPGVVGSKVVIEAVPHTVVGVAPAGFRVTGRPELFTAFAWDPQAMPSRDSNFLLVLGRVAAGRAPGEAAAELESVYAALVREHPAGTPGGITNQGVAVRPLDEWLIAPERRRQLLVLWGAVAMVLLVACANVANLLLARAESRQRELAVRAALGAGRGRIAWHFLSESLLVSAAGAAIGVAGAHAGLRLLIATHEGGLPRADEVGLDGPVLLFALGTCLVTALAVGLAPALSSSARGGGGAGLERSLREGGRGASDGRSRLRPALVVVEVAAALVVLVGAGLLLQSFWRLEQVDLGTEPSRVLTAGVSLPDPRYPDVPRALGFFDRLVEEAARLPGVEAAGIVSAAPFTGNYSNFSRLAAARDPERQASFVEVRTASPGYFDALGIELLRGRMFGPEDHQDAPPVMLINAELARRLFPDADPVGETITPSPEADGFRVIGVVEDLREHGPASPPPPTVYLSPGQGIRAAMTLTVRTAGDPLELAGAVRGVVGRLDPELPLFEVATLDQLVYRDLAPRRFVLRLLTLFAALALALGAVGIYGVTAYTVEQRRREIGIRQALGATPGAVLRQVVGQGVRLAALGVAVGLAGAFLLRRTMAGMLYEVGTFDPAVYAAGAVALTAIAAIACAVPARRAAAVDPLRTLREG